MIKKRLLLILLLICACSGLRGQSFNLQTGREPIASLDGLWRFHTGDNPQWASPNFDDSQWPLLRSDEPWNRKSGYEGYSGYAWYRFTIQVPDSSKPLELRLTGIITGYQVYANGILIGGEGSSSPTRDPAFAFLPAAFPLPTGGAGPQTIHIAIRVWHYELVASYFWGGPEGPGNAVGDRALILHQLQRHQDAHALALVNIYASCLLAIFAGITALALFLFRRQDREYLWFAILLLAGAANLVPNIVVNLRPMPSLLHDLSTDIAWAVSIIAALAFFSIVLEARRSFLWWIACFLAAVSPLFDFDAYFAWATLGMANVIQFCFLLPAFFWILITLAICALRKETTARLLLVPAALLYGYFAIDNITAITYQLGLQRTRGSLDIALMHRPFPLHPTDVIWYIFILALLIFLVRRFSLARQEEARLSTEMESARTMQSLMVPATAPSTPGFAIESVYFPATEVGGDFFQVQPSEGGSLLIIVGDVSGKGLKAAMTVSTIVGALRNERSRQPAEILANLNRVLHGQIGGFVTCCAVLIAAKGETTIANAGHLAPYRNGEELAVEGGLPLGMLADVSYRETHVQLAPGGRLAFMSDGVVEARNTSGELYGFDRTQQISNQPAHVIAETAKNFGQEDDITVVAIQFIGAEISGAPRACPELVEGTRF